VISLPLRQGQARIITAQGFRAVSFLIELLRFAPGALIESGLGRASQAPRGTPDTIAGLAQRSYPVFIQSIQTGLDSPQCG
jgi:hypothetical protein